MSNLDFANSVIMPREDFIELQTAAWDTTPTTVGTRIASTVQTTLVCAVLAGAFTAGCWGWAKATDWLEEKNYQRETRKRNRTDTTQK